MGHTSVDRDSPWFIPPSPFRRLARIATTSPLPRSRTVGGSGSSASLAIPLLLPLWLYRIPPIAHPHDEPRLLRVPQLPVGLGPPPRGASSMAVRPGYSLTSATSFANFSMSGFPLTDLAMAQPTFTRPAVACSGSIPVSCFLSSGRFSSAASGACGSQASQSPIYQGRHTSGRVPRSLLVRRSTPPACPPRPG